MYAVRKPVENPYLIRERDRRRTRELLGFSLALLPPLCVLFWAMRASLDTIQVGYQLGRLEKQREVLVEKRRQLEVERANAASLARTELIARQSLGLGAARAEQIILVKDPSSPLSTKESEPAGSLPSPPSTAGTEEGF